MVEPMRDLVVAGGGPVGLAAALHARRTGLDVVVVEPRTGDVDKACGEGLMPGALARLADLGVEVAGIDLAGIRYRDERRSVDARFRHGPGRGVRRTTLHAGLSRRLAEEGIEVRHEAVRSVVDRGTHLLVDGRPTRYLLAADGLHSPVRRLVGLESPVRGARRYGQRCHLRVAPWSDFVEVHWAAHAEAYVTPVAPDLVGLAILSSRRAPFATLVEGFGELRERVAAAESTRVLGAGPLRQSARHRVAGRVLLVGDAAGYVDALTGEGIALGLAEAAAAVAAVVADAPDGYDATSRRLRRRHELLTRGLVTATRHQVVRRRLVAAADRVPWAFDAAVNQLARPA